MGKLDTVEVNGPEAEVLDWGRRGLAPRRGRCTAAAAATLHWACLSRLPGKRARPVLRGPRRGDASGLPDWKPFYYLLQDLPGVEVMLVNARHVKNLPGRKTDLLTELSRDLEEGYVRRRVRPVRFAACDRRWGYASGFVRAGGAAAGLSGGDGRSV